MTNLGKILTLLRPLAILDCESTGVDPERDRIIQIAIETHYPDHEPVSWSTFINPGMTIPPESQEAHGITDEMVKNAPPFAHYAGQLAAKAAAWDWGGHNVIFDLRLLRCEMRRANVKWDWESTSKVIDSLALSRMLHPHDLASEYERVTGLTLVNAHDALADVRASAVVFAGKLMASSLAPRTVPELAEFCFPQRANSVDRGGKIVWRNGVASLGFGKWNGTPLANVARSYLEWMLNGDFPADVKKIVSDAMLGVYPGKEEAK